MKGDFTRSTFKKEKHYSSVRMQQGRVQLDADWNEQADIQAYFDQTEAKDVIGRTGVPKYGGGFKIEASGNDLTISPGRIYVDGILCELEEPGTTYLKQPDFPEAPVVEPGDYLVYLDVWERHITALEDDYIREKALGGPDTATRAKTIRQVKLQAAEVLNCDQIGPGWQPDDAKRSGQLSARAKTGEISDDPCILPPGGGYRRLENQLYRVEIHESGALDTATFKWSRDNGSIVAKLENISGEEITVSHAVQSRLNEFAAGRWLEVTDDYHELHEKPGTLVRILKIENNIIFIEPTTQIGTENITPANFPSAYQPKIRLWDSIGTLKVEIPLSNDGFIPLEDGVEVKFAAGDYVTGDYWFIPARHATRDVEWPKDENDPTKHVFKDPDGIKHHYAQLALVEFTNEIFNLQQDCRDIFPPLNEVTIGKGCCTLTVGDGKTSFGDVDTIQAAVDKLLQGGQICLLPGYHQANVIIEKGKNITIRGCGNQGIVIPPENNENNIVQPLFTLKNSQHIILENMDMIHSEGTAVQVEKSALAGLREIEISHNRILALKHAVRVDDEDGEKINICGNTIRMADREEGDVAIYMMAKNSQIEDNDIMVVPLENLITGRGFDSNASIHSYWYYILNKYPSQGFNAPGGIQLGGGSENIMVKGNCVQGGSSNGITLGHIPQGPDVNIDYVLLSRIHYGINNRILSNNLEAFKNSFIGIITGVEISGNKIKYMGLNGIGVVNIFSLTEVAEMVSVDGLTITGNIITECLQQMPREIEDTMRGEMAFAGIALSDTENVIIRENRIEKNGISFMAPACGIFIRHGERIDISDNHILNNGPTQKETLDQAAFRIGIGGGVVIMMSMGKMMTDLKAGNIPYVDGFPAVKIHDNIITQPMGKALYIVAMGPVSILGNHLVSRGFHPKILFYPYWAGSVMIFNLGVSRDLFLRTLISTFKAAAASMNSSFFSRSMPTGSVFTSAGSYTYNINRISPNSFTYCRSCDANAAGAPTVTNPGDTVSTLPSRTSSIKEILLYLPPGSVLFANNRIIMDLRSPGQDFIICSQLIASLDDISYAGNQSECNTFFDTIQTDVFTMGNTIRTNDNRFQEGLTLALYSLLSIALMMNTWTGNQASHCLTAIGILKEEKGNNLVLYNGYFFDMINVPEKSYCQSSREWLFSKLKPGQVSTLPPDGSD